ncbi:hypothetical protein DSL72_009014 [Monilinia vaccinii-corymbosi]|uniref:Uncharacterized protein n=1 Tax=Monilinia vaccinii-corymbosi TaxID=61207 RepID=A0A8A3PPU9_9HELO|nr:hypothetical protein DSL72_009014 [Monilinia vaccinii-corymbosi]
MGLSKVEHIVIFTLLTFFFIFLFIFLLFAPRLIYLRMKEHATIPSHTDVDDWVQQGVDATSSVLRRRRTGGQGQASRARPEDVETGVCLGKEGKKKRLSKLILRISGWGMFMEEDQE